MALKIKLTASKIDTFYGCRRLYKYRYITKPFVEDKKAFVVGNIAHKALELYHRKDVNIPSATVESAPTLLPKTMGECFRRAVQSELGLTDMDQAFVNKFELISVKEMLKNYQAWYKHEQSNIIMLEKMFYFNIDNISVSGKADRLCKTDNRYVVVDYKTSKQIMRNDEMLESVQLPTYAMWVKTFDTKANVTGHYLFLRHLKGVAGSVWMDIDDNLIESTKARYKEMAGLLQNGCDFSKNESYKYHRTCEYKEICSKES